VRGREYFADGKKAPSARGASELLAVELFRAKSPVEAVGSRLAAPSHTLQQRTSSPLASVFVVSLIIPAGSGGVLQLVLYFGVLAAAASGPAHKLLRAFTAPDTTDAWRNGRFKIIPGVEAGPWIVRKAVGNKSTPAILGKQLKQTFSSSPGVFEVAVDCNSSPAAGRIVSMVKSQARHLAVDLAFLIEPQSASELAERVLGCVRISHVSLANDLIPEYCGTEGEDE